MFVEDFQNFVDPSTGYPLHLREFTVDGGHVKEGKLESGREKRTTFEIRDFIPRFVNNQGYTQNFGLQWQHYAKTQLDSYNGASYSRDRLFQTTKWTLDCRLEKETILEVGSGAGRFTEILLSTNAIIYSFDLSDAVNANFVNNGRHPNLRLFQANVYSMPLRKKSFDRVICMGVLQHTPNVHRSFCSLLEMVRSGGQLIVDIYPWVWTGILHWKYLIRPITTKMQPDKLWKLVHWYAPKLMPIAHVLYKIGGRGARRLVPIMDQSDKKVSKSIQRDWTILDTFDALAAAYDKPQSNNSLRAWFLEAGFSKIEIESNGIIGRGTAP